MNLNLCNANCCSSYLNASLNHLKIYVLLRLKCIKWKCHSVVRILPKQVRRTVRLQVHSCHTSCVYLYTCEQCRSVITHSDTGRLPEADALLTTATKFALKTCFTLFASHVKPSQNKALWTLWQRLRSFMFLSCTIFQIIAGGGCCCELAEAASQYFHLWLEQRVVTDCGDRLRWSAAPPPPTGSQKAICTAKLLCGGALSYFMSHMNLLPALSYLDCRRRVYHVYCGENKGSFSTC